MSMHPFNISTISMYPSSMLTDENVSLKFPMTKYIIMIIHTCINGF